MSLDPRLTPARPDLAAAELRGRVEASRIVEGERRRVAVPVAPLRRAPVADAPLETQALFGECVRVFEDDAEGWSWVQLEADHYVGYLPGDALVALSPEPTHRVRALRTFVFPGPDIKLPPLETLTFGARLAVRGQKGPFAITLQGAVFADHLEPLDGAQGQGQWQGQGLPGGADYVAVAARFLETPYLWGGRSAFGLDCSGLVQTALAACGISAPRDSDQQEAALGAPIATDGPFQRGDLLFWPGHVAIVEAPDTLLHANAFHMMVAREPLSGALARIGATSALRAAKRLSP